MRVKVLSENVPSGDSGEIEHHVSLSVVGGMGQVNASEADIRRVEKAFGMEGAQRLKFDGSKVIHLWKPLTKEPAS
jgi:hypothetical protein